jgi:hypothetical protein
MTHTTEQARDLWCPMARVAQAGNVDIPVAYNRSLTKEVKAAEVVAYASAEEFKLGGEATGSKTIMVMDATPGVSMAANCVGEKCAMWRWAEPEHAVHRVRVMCKQFDAQVEPERPAGMNPALVFTPHEPGDDGGACWVEPEHLWLARRRGYCGLAGRPEVMA